MDEFMMATQAAQAFYKKNGGVVLGLTRQMDGRWFLRWIPEGRETWIPEKNVFISYDADLGVMTTDE